MNEQELATPGIARRLASMAYELIILLAVLLFFVLLPQWFYAAFAQHPPAPAFVRAHFFLTLLVYFGWFWTHGGQTLAMKTWRLQLCDAGGGPLRWGQVLLRYTLCYPSVLLGIGVVWALFDRDRQFLHDRISGTRIVELPALPKKKA